jgi:hypothetical protein
MDYKRERESRKRRGREGKREREGRRKGKRERERRRENRIKVSFSLRYASYFPHNYLKNKFLPVGPRVTS